MKNIHIEKAIAEAQNGVIDLGCANGWSTQTSELYSSLKEHMIEGSGDGEYLGRCYSRTTFKVNLDEAIYEVTYTIDSSD